MKSIFTYIDYRDFLQEYISAKQDEGRAWSLRALSKRLGIGSSGHLSMIIRGERNLTKALADKITAQFHLNEREAAYFKSLLLFNRSKKRDEKEAAFEQMKALRSISKTIISSQQSALYSEWYIPVVRELINIGSFTEKSILSIGKRVKPHLKQSEIKHAVSTLLSLKLIQKDENDTLKLSQKLISSGSEFDRFTIQQYTLKTLDIAKESLENVQPERRELSTVSMSINHDTYKEIQRRMANFRNEIMELALQSKNPDLVYQMNMQLFPFVEGEES